MDLVYTTYRHQNSLKKHPEWQQEGFTLVTVSSRNTVLFTTSTLLNTSESPVSSWGCHLYCADLNTPWEPSLVTSADCSIVSVTWDVSGSRFVCADLSGVVTVWESEENSVSDWRVIATNKYNHEKFIAASFFSKSRPVMINHEKRESVVWSEKFTSPSLSRHSSVDGCVLVSGSGLLLTVGFTTDQEPVFRSCSLGLGRRRVNTADLVTTGDGQLMVAVSGSAGSVMVYSVVSGWEASGDLSVRVNSHSSFSLKHEHQVSIISRK